MTRFKKCDAWLCEGIATKVVKVYAEEYEEQLGGWKDTNESGTSNLRSVGGGGFAVPKIRKFNKANVCKSCYDAADPEFFRFADFYGNVKKVSRVEQV